MEEEFKKKRTILYKKKIEDINKELQSVYTQKERHDNIKFIQKEYNIDLLFLVKHYLLKLEFADNEEEKDIIQKMANKKKEINDINLEINNLSNLDNELELQQNNDEKIRLRMELYPKKNKLNNDLRELANEYKILRMQHYEQHEKKSEILLREREEELKVKEEKKAERDKKLEEQKSIKDPMVLYGYETGNDVIGVEEDVIINDFIDQNKNKNEKTIIFKVLSSDFKDEKSRYYLYTYSDFAKIDRYVYPCNDANNSYNDINGEKNIQDYIPLINLYNICGVNACIYANDYMNISMKNKNSNVVCFVIIPDKDNTVPTISKKDYQNVAGALHCNAGGEPVQIWEVKQASKIEIDIIDKVYKNVYGGSSSSSSSRRSSISKSKRAIKTKYHKRVGTKSSHKRAVTTRNNKRMAIKKQNKRK
jgi:hypothetical protein